MRIPAVEKYIVSELMRVGAESVVKIDWATAALEKCYKNKQIRENWPKFTDSVIDILNDAINEVRVAKTWTHKGG